MAAVPESGFLLIADITGYTAYLARGEIQHGPTIAGDLLETVIGRLERPVGDGSDAAVEGIGIEHAARWLPEGLDGNGGAPSPSANRQTAEWTPSRPQAVREAADRSPSATSGAPSATGSRSPAPRSWVSG